MSLAEARREVIVEAPEDGRGARKEATGRALTLVEKLHRLGVLTYEEWQAAGQLRNMYFLLHPPSEGVSSYGQGTGGADPTKKGDRKAKRITGVEVHLNGSITRGPSRDNKSDRWRYQDAIFAMAGCHTDEGEKVVDRKILDLMLRAVTDSERMPTQLEIGQARMGYSDAQSKKQSAVGANFVKEHLNRLALHLRMVKGEAMK
jgi:hypothetical protein